MCVQRVWQLVVGCKSEVLTEKQADVVAKDFCRLVDEPFSRLWPAMVKQFLVVCGVDLTDVKSQNITIGGDYMFIHKAFP